MVEYFLTGLSALHIQFPLKSMGCGQCFKMKGELEAQNVAADGKQRKNSSTTLKWQKNDLAMTQEVITLECDFPVWREKGRQSRCKLLPFLTLEQSRACCQVVLTHKG